MVSCVMKRPCIHYYYLLQVSTILCNICCAANYCFIIVSMLTLAFISIERYIAVVHPLRHNVMITSSVVAGMVIYPWCQGVIFASVPSILHWVHYDYWEAVCAINWFYQKKQAVYYVISAFTLCFALPGGVMMYCYISIMKEAQRSQRKIIKISPQDSKKSKENRNALNIAKKFAQTTKTLRSLLVVVLLFFICMTPFCVTKLLKVIANSDSIVPPYVNLMSSYFGYLSSLVNPFIYAIFRADFRSAYRRLYLKLNCRKHSIRISTTSVNSQLSASVVDYPALYARTPQLAERTIIPQNREIYQETKA